jgi:hypothetical protein
LMYMGAPIDHSRHKKFTKFFLISITSVNLCGGLISFVAGDVTGAYESSFLMVFSDFFTTQLFMFLCAQFMFFMWTVEIRYRHVNSVLKKNFKFDEFVGEKASKPKVKTLTKIAILYEKIMKISERLSRCYGTPVRTSFKSNFHSRLHSDFQMMFVFGSSFSFIVLMIFVGLKFMILDGNPMCLFMTFVMFFYSVIMISFLLGIALMGQLVEIEVNIHCFQHSKHSICYHRHEKHPRLFTKL